MKKSLFPAKRMVFTLNNLSGSRYAAVRLFIVKITSPNGITAKQFKAIKKRRDSWGNMSRKEPKFREGLEKAFREIAQCSIEINIGVIAF